MGKTENAIAQMEAWARDDSHGYDQIYRWGQRGDYDCSAAVILAWELAGVPVKTNGATYTGNMKKVFLATGFSDVTKSVNLSTGSGLKRGDVLLNEGDHTAMFCGNGQLVQASINEKGGVSGGQPGDQTGKEFWIRSYYNYPWDCVLRYSKAEETEDTYMFTCPTVKYGEYGTHVLLVQEILKARGFKGKDGKELALDRSCGANTVYAIKAYQTATKRLEVDGVAGPKTLADMIAL